MAISNAKRQWEIMQTSVRTQGNRQIQQPMPDLVANHVANVPNRDFLDPDEESESSRSRYSICIYLAK